MEREIINITPHMSGPIVCDYAFDFEEYEEYFDKDGEQNENEAWLIWNSFKTILEEVTYYDLEKGYENVETIVKRLSDGKYFKGNWFRSHYIENEYPDKLIEVFPKEITITIYE